MNYVGNSKMIEVISYFGRSHRHSLITTLPYQIGGVGLLPKYFPTYGFGPQLTTPT